MREDFEKQARQNILKEEDRGVHSLFVIAVDTEAGRLREKSRADKATLLLANMLKAIEMQAKHSLLVLDVSTAVIEATEFLATPVESAS